MNKVIQTLRFCKDPEVRYTQGANPTAIASFSGAVERRFKREGEPDADFFNYTAFGKQAEFVEKYFRKGMKALITGRIQNNNYQNRDGQTVYGQQILIDEIEFAESKNAGAADDGGHTRANTPAPAQRPSGDEFMSIPDGLDDDLPFH